MVGSLQFPLAGPNLLHLMYLGIMRFVSWAISQKTEVR